MLKSLPYGNYSVPLVIKDQQGGGGAEDVVMAVVICDCGGGDTCRGKLPASTNVGPSVIGLACGALLLFRMSPHLFELFFFSAADFCSIEPEPLKAVNKKTYRVQF